MFKRQTLIAWLTLVAISMMPFTALAQTQIKYHSNKYSVQDDIKLGRQAAQEAESQFPLLRDSEVQSYVENVGRRLVSSIPSQFQHPEFQYYFKVVNARDINAFALPGGPMYVNRGMIEAARTEGEMAGVMESIWRCDLGDKKMCSQMLSILHNQFYRESIPRYLEQIDSSSGESKIGNKSGADDGVRNDVALIESNAGSFVISIFTWDNKDNSWSVDNTAELLIAHMAKTIVEAWAPTANSQKAQK